MLGLQEILIITAIILGVIFLPRRFGKQPEQRSATKIRLSGKMRAAVAASAIYLILSAAYFEPWRHKLGLFLYIGIGPVALGWLVCWVVLGFIKK